MKLFLHYLRSKALKIGAFLLFALLFLVSFRLYHLPLAAVTSGASDSGIWSCSRS